jgi:hypothetical protein
MEASSHIHALGRGLRWFKWSVINLVSTLVFAELSLQAFATWSGTSFLLSPTLDGYRLTPGRNYGNGLRGNSLGYPGAEFQRDKPAGIRRIAALGDSFAVGPAVPFADNFLTLLESELPGWQVYNFGVSGTGPREYYAILNQHVWQFQPDLVLVSVFVGNDITESLATPRYMDPRRHAVYVLLTRAARLMRERWRQGMQDPEGFVDRLTAGAMSEETFREVEARRLAVCQVPPSADIQKKWQRSLSYLDRIVQACRRKGVPAAFVLIPDEFQVNRAVLAAARTDRHIDEDSIDVELPQRRLYAFLAQRGAACLDLLDAFQGAGDTYAPRDTHWNVRGNRLAAERIALWLRTVPTLLRPLEQGSQVVRPCLHVIDPDLDAAEFSLASRHSR